MNEALSLVISATFSAMLPSGVSKAKIEIRPEWIGQIGVSKLMATGLLPSGMPYEVPLDVDMQALHHDNMRAWLNSIELARELRKAAHAFKVMVALEGSIGKVGSPQPRFPFVLFLRSNEVVLCAEVPAGTERLKTQLVDSNSGTLNSVNEVSHRGGGELTYSFQGLRSNERYMLRSLTAIYPDGQRSSWNDPSGRVSFTT